MTPLRDHERNPWGRFDSELEARRAGRPEGGTGTLLLLCVFFAILGAIGVLGLFEPRVIPFRFPLIGGVGRYVIALACIWVAFIGLRMTIRFWRTGR